MNIDPSLFTPATAQDFCGPASQVARILEKLINRAPASHRVLLKGPPGTGKTSLAKWFCRQLAGPLGDFNIIHTNGTKVNVEAVDAFLDHTRYTSQGYRCILIDEADAIPPTAQVRMLTFLDHVKEIRNVAVVATSNYDFDKFPERLQTRFKPFEVLGPSEAELATFLARFVPSGQFAPVQNLAAMAEGNVRQALEDLDTALLAA